MVQLDSPPIWLFLSHTAYIQLLFFPVSSNNQQANNETLPKNSIFHQIRNLPGCNQILGRTCTFAFPAAGENEIRAKIAYPVQKRDNPTLYCFMFINHDGGGTAGGALFLEFGGKSCKCTYNGSRCSIFIYHAALISCVIKNFALASLSLPRAWNLMKITKKLLLTGTLNTKNCFKAEKWNWWCFFFLIFIQQNVIGILPKKRIIKILYLVWCGFYQFGQYKSDCDCCREFYIQPLRTFTFLWVCYL